MPTRSFLGYVWRSYISMGHVKTKQKAGATLNIAKFVVVGLCLLGTVWFPAWILAVIVYEAWVRRGKDVVAMWIVSKGKDNEWD